MAYGYRIRRVTGSSYPNELAHYGILGQKWGNRRFQNEDGTLTEEGKKRYGTVPPGGSRYKRGKEINREHANVYKKERARLEKEDEPKRNEIYDELSRITNKYGLDGDDGGGGDRERFSEKQLQWASNKFWDLSDEIDRLDEKEKQQSLKKATDHVMKKYGETALSDMRFYKNVKNGAILAIVLAALGGLIYTDIKW